MSVIDTRYCYERCTPAQPTALILLNCESAAGAPKLSPFLCALWSVASVRLCADGAASRLFHSIVRDALGCREPGAAPEGAEHGNAAVASALRAYLPDEIVGDWDSIDARTEAYYRGAGVALFPQPEDQDSTDLEKCFKRLVVRQGQHQQRLRVVVAGSFGGRLDHTVQNLNCLFKWTPHFEALSMITEHSLACLLPHGGCEVRVARPMEGPTCGILPLKGPTVLSTQGLQWDVAGAPSEFGGMVSTSNSVCGLPGGDPGAPVVKVHASVDCVWTIGVNPGSVAACGGSGGNVVEGAT